MQRGLLQLLLSAYSFMLHSGFSSSLVLVRLLRTFHDVLAVLGMFFIMGREINLILVTALLTIAGYSLTDTVVVFDRIRENLKLKQRESVEAVMNTSIMRCYQGR